MHREKHPVFLESRSFNNFGQTPTYNKTKNRKVSLLHHAQNLYFDAETHETLTKFRSESRKYLNFSRETDLSTNFEQTHTHNSTKNTYESLLHNTQDMYFDAETHEIRRKRSEAASFSRPRWDHLAKRPAWRTKETCMQRNGLVTPVRLTCVPGVSRW